jgi:hypothetical protein
MTETRTKQPLSSAQWAELQQIADRFQGPKAPNGFETRLDELLSPQLSHLRPVAEALISEMRRER